MRRGGPGNRYARFNKDENLKKWNERESQLYPTRNVSSIPEQQSAPEKLSLTVEKSRFLDEFFRYSGYNLFATSSSEAKKKGKKDAQVAAAYTAKYLKVEGSRTLFDEITEPSHQLFPEELLKNVPFRPPTIHAGRVFRYFSSSKALKRREKSRDSYDVPSKRSKGNDDADEDDTIIVNNEDSDEDVQIGQEADVDEVQTDSENEDLEDGDYGEIYDDFDEDGVDEYADDLGEGED